MQPHSSWHLLLLLFITSSLADWSLDPPSGGGGLDDLASKLRLDGNPIVPNAVTDEFSTGTTDGVPNLAQVPQDENVGGESNVGNDPSTFEVASGCSPPSSAGKKRRRVRRGDPISCPSGFTFENTPSQFKKPTEPGRQQTPPSADPGTKKAPSANASPRKFIPKLSPEAEHLSGVFLPKENRPQEDDYTCRKAGFNIAVCAHDDSGLQDQSGSSFVNFLDPCFPFPQFGSCPPLLDGWCCQRVEITLTSSTQDLFAPFRETLMSREQISQSLQTNINPFKFIGISCIQIPKGQDYLPAY